ncbi:hypothetical protein NSTCB13_05511 [Nostoc sp. DSM 114160]|jgi:Ca2+-binding RTX toxin-like protein
MAIIIGTSGNDTLQGASDYYDDTLTGGGGNDNHSSPTIYL